MKDEISLRDYINVLLKRWNIVVCIMVIALMVALLVSFLSPSNYRATATVLIIKNRSDIVLEPKYQTISEDDVVSQRNTLAALAKSTIVAQKVINKLGNELSPGEQAIGSLLGEVTVRTQGDLIELQVESTVPQKAASIANAWAQSYQEYINDLYSGMSLTPEELLVQVDAAQKVYDEQQRSWEAFSGENRIDALTRQISDKELLYNIKSLREQLQAGASSTASDAANSLSFILLQASAFNSQPQANQPQANQPQASAINSQISQLQISLDNLSDINVLLGDVDVLTATLEARSGGEKGQSFNELQQEILRLKGDMEKEQAKQRELQKSRDIAWDTIQTLHSKLAEVKVSSLLNNIVRVAEPATVPDSPVGRGRAVNIGIALVVGLIIGIFSAFGVEYFKESGENNEDE